VVKKTLSEMVDEYFRRSASTLTQNPLETLLAYLLDDWLHILNREVVIESISEMVSEVFVELEFDKLFDRVAIPMFTAMFQIQLNERKLELTIEWFIDLVSIWNDLSLIYNVEVNGRGNQKSAARELASR
jgi:hypothetical protein